MLSWQKHVVKVVAYRIWSDDNKNDDSSFTSLQLIRILPPRNNEFLLQIDRHG